MRLLLIAPCLAFAVSAVAQNTQAGVLARPSITLDEFLNTSSIATARISPDGSAAAFEISSPDWQHDRNAKDIWLWTRAGGLTQITHTGHDTSPLFSPDGRFVAFLSDRPLSAETMTAGPAAGKPVTDEPARIWVLPLAGGEAFPLFHEALDTHAFAWAKDSGAILLSTRQVHSHTAEEAYKAEWKDTVQWREQERGDVLLSCTIEAAIHEAALYPQAHVDQKTVADKPAYPEAAHLLAEVPFEIHELAISPAGDQIAFESAPVHHRVEKPEDFELYLLPSSGGTPRQLTHNQGLESQLNWAATGKAIDFVVPTGGGSIEGPYRDVQGRLYSVDVASGTTTRLGSSFTGSWSELAVGHDGAVIATGITGLQRGLYKVEGDRFTALSALPGTFEGPQLALHGSSILFLRSAINQPTQAYLASDLTADSIAKAQPLTALNPIFATRAQPTWKPFKWTAPDGVPVEGLLIFPPGKQDEKKLRMLTLIHGGPADADGDHFGADWYDWANLAAAQGWLVFRPNYRGSTGYGDAFQLGITPHLVSVPGKDILAGVDALVAAGLADPQKLAIGGYSYGGYMTNWLITQTTRFKAAVTGAGAVEHAANWGNDDLTFDDAWYLSGAPWQKPELYQSEAALFQLDKVTTPTHIVGGDQDNRVSFLEDVLLERGLQTLKVPHALLVFPGENHPLRNNPWHGYIKVREELKWLEKYVPKQ